MQESLRLLPGPLHELSQNVANKAEDFTEAVARLGYMADVPKHVQTGVLYLCWLPLSQICFGGVLEWGKQQQQSILWGHGAHPRGIVQLHDR